MRNKIYNEDILKFLPTLPDKSCDLFILDPPYMNVVDEDWDKQWRTIDEYMNWCERWIKEVSRIGKYSSSVWVFGFPYQLSSLIPIFEKYGFKFKQQIVIWKGMKSAAGRVSNKLKMFPTTTECIYFFYYDSCEIIRDLLNKEKDRKKLTPKEINGFLGKAIHGGGTWSSIAGLKQKTLQQPTKEDWEKLNTLFDGNLPPYEDMVYKFNLPHGLTDVWDDIRFYFKQGTKFHPTQKPDQLIQRLVECSSNKGDLVIDFFMGSGSTILNAKELNRDFIGCDIDPDYFNVVQNRLNNPNYILNAPVKPEKEKGKKRKKELLSDKDFKTETLNEEVDLKDFFNE
jgi:DNA modification methylase